MDMSDPHGTMRGRIESRQMKTKKISVFKTSKNMYFIFNLLSSVKKLQGTQKLSEQTKTGDSSDTFKTMRFLKLLPNYLQSVLHDLPILFHAFI